MISGSVRGAKKPITTMAIKRSSQSIGFAPADLMMSKAQITTLPANRTDTRLQPISLFQDKIKLRAS
jgi:hypothetical protein